MPRLTIGLGVVLIVIGIIAYIATAFASWTALIPAILGVVLLICGVIAVKRPRGGLYAALVIAVLGILGTAMNVAQIGDLLAGDAERPAAVITSVITFVLLIAYVVIGVTSIIRGRRHRAVTA
ncbi:hypothetical protein GCM10011490_04970 [Pseudoclavibacter endophyticus]|uniref:Cytochrome d ubiquinol oxidase subunit II n=1 Tax=Pseudoclavibacter endophyticus TaxID=1778590 RepID=A0A6H9WM84_9MICO|nr:cytochrome d ubiquinol oxidase subunit II [Pseudoclavibacter endophyticus]KAB1649996.1 cytochrome d ubiquinol oxidase subunit II [Pseudoclavibacter endophyticus]GGA58091.1 hypothetical protein GCM10011490_04970 [Pseudoclavibacter endophyticus]